MSLRTSQKTTTTTYRTVKAASPEPVTSVVATARTASPLPYTVNGYETLRYLVPMQQQQQQQYVLMQQPMVHQVVQQPMVQQVMSPVYLQNLQHLSVSSQDSDLLLLQQCTARVSGTAGLSGREAKSKTVRIPGVFSFSLRRPCGECCGVFFSSILICAFEQSLRFESAFTQVVVVVAVGAAELLTPMLNRFLWQG